MFSVMMIPKSTITPIAIAMPGQAHDVRAHAEQLHDEKRKEHSQRQTHRDREARAHVQQKRDDDDDRRDDRFHQRCGHASRSSPGSAAIDHRTKRRSVAPGRASGARSSNRRLIRVITVFGSSRTRMPMIAPTCS